MVTRNGCGQRPDAQGAQRKAVAFGERLGIDREKALAGRPREPSRLPHQTAAQTTTLPRRVDPQREQPPRTRLRIDLAERDHRGGLLDHPGRLPRQRCGVGAQPGIPGREHGWRIT
jgi:hypothetical protein